MINHQIIKNSPTLENTYNFNKVIQNKLTKFLVSDSQGLF